MYYGISFREIFSQILNLVYFLIFIFVLNVSFLYKLKFANDTGTGIVWRVTVVSPFLCSTVRTGSRLGLPLCSTVRF